jgi:hypothetical protein
MPRLRLSCGNLAALYSAALKSSNIVWSDDTVDGAQNPVDVISFLRDRSNNDAVGI